MEWNAIYNAKRELLYSIIQYMEWNAIYNAIWNLHYDLINGGIETGSWMM